MLAAEEEEEAAKAAKMKLLSEEDRLQVQRREKFRTVNRSYIFLRTPLLTIPRLAAAICAKEEVGGGQQSIPGHDAYGGAGHAHQNPQVCNGVGSCLRWRACIDPPVAVHNLMCWGMRTIVAP